MTDTPTTGVPTTNELALERTRLASVRTEFALMRTGFTIASFGAGVAQLLGRDRWHDWATDGLTVAFVLLGMVVVQSGLIRFQISLKKLGTELHANPFYQKAMNIMPWGLQISLLALLILILVY